MPRRAKGPRLYLKQRAGRDAAWIIRDGTYEESTGCGVGCMSDAEQRLGEYILGKTLKEGAGAARSKRDPAQVAIAEVLALYAAEHATTLKADPKSTAGFVKHLLGWWGDKMVADVKRSTCKAYVAHRTAQPIRHGATGRMVSDQTARRELETLSAAIGYWHGEDPLYTRPTVWLPDKPESQRDALTRNQAAALLKAARGYRWDVEAGAWKRLRDSGPSNRAHMKRFILLGLYTGSRSKVITSLLREESPAHPFQDLDKGMIYRRGRAERETANKRRPVVKLPPRLLAHMRRWDRKDRALKETPSSIIHHGGNPVGKVRRGFDACAADAGLPEDVTPHWLRHTAATWLMEGGADIWDACAYLGMSPKMLIDNYGHHRPDHNAGAIKAMGGKR
jgi:integrase